MNVPGNLLYTKEHEWVRVDGNKAVIGITDHAQHALGDITYVDLPKAGVVLEQFKFCATVESVKAASDVYAPLSGTVLRANEDLKTRPELINQAPYVKGWLAEIELAAPVEKDKLMSPQAYEDYLKGLK